MQLHSWKRAKCSQCLNAIHRENQLQRQQQWQNTGEGVGEARAMRPNGFNGTLFPIPGNVWPANRLPQQDEYSDSSGSTRKLKSSVEFKPDNIRLQVLIRKCELTDAQQQLVTNYLRVLYEILIKMPLFNDYDLQLDFCLYSLI